MMLKSAEEKARRLVLSAFPDAEAYSLKVTDTRNPRFHRVDILNKAGVVFPAYYFLVDMDEEVVHFGDPHMNSDRMVELADVGGAVKVGEQG